MLPSLLISALLCSTTVSAFPATKSRLARRWARQRQGATPRNVTTPVTMKDAESGDDYKAQYSDNWAGAVLVGSDYTSVSGTIVVPTPKLPSRASPYTQYAASPWVGIDGDTCGSAILQTGLDLNIQGSSVSFDAWYEWYPEESYTFDIEINAGDEVKMEVKATSTSSGSATIENLSTGKSVTHTFKNQANKLCLTNAEWIMEDASYGSGELVPFPNFGSVEFTDATAVSKGRTVSTSGSTIMDIRQTSVLTSCSASEESVRCTYV